MIQEIQISNLGVITEATLPLGPGLTVVTGETGAGKTMVITALSLLLGRRADAGAVRNGAKHALAEAVVHLPPDHHVLDAAGQAGAFIEPAGENSELLLSRSLSAQGRSRATIGGRSAPVGLLAELGHDLVAVHGQSDQIRLKEPVAQRDALDRFAGSSLSRTLSNYQRAYRQWRSAAKELASLKTESRNRVREAENLRLALDEIDSLDPQPGEDESLREQSMKLGNVESLRTASQQAQAVIDSEDFENPGVTTLVETARGVLAQASDDDAGLAAFAERAAELGILASELSSDLAAYVADLDEEGPERLAQIEARRADLSKLMRKYAPSIDEVLAWASESRIRLEQLGGDDSRIEALEVEVVDLEHKVASLASDLSDARRKAAKKLSTQVSAELKALAMPDAKLVIEVNELDEPGAFGQDAISMLLAPHAGASPRPLGKGASGGELSRVMLAIEVVLAAVDPVPTFVFDEVDQGVGGKAAVAIGERLAMLAKHVQVIVVTHLPQVAAYADRHIRVIKNSDAKSKAGAGYTASDVISLDQEARVKELARMLAGQEESDTAQAHAEELLEEAQNLVSSLTSKKPVKA
ncbi:MULTISPECIES: DNA repair protein RecN [Glutamicibacter]|uniref:DNA repair protein RecN n=2 Tax=Glutamicibacter arilaitensis TaxID=256701 RepID=A0A2N7S5K4_9MICC|nr:MULTISPECIES: DNA repair protein RecN [Glutamicibacter]PMQ21423.1 DNA repair protein RecN [Glutamicibacter arilaitensis]CBT75374.1 DNA repair protein RecN [Glutamicibacter arilaitensis Re117]HCH47262.1 DNA repair protein RecN [Glutamicibacter sp.]HCJ55489.1 DNA repair protein RecN [Glutamicibacter sp.]HCM94735.1 DNA repair protein RecN [Glutamicibacter sp.]